MSFIHLVGEIVNLVLDVFYRSIVQGSRAVNGHEGQETALEGYLLRHSRMEGVRSIT